MSVETSPTIGILGLGAMGSRMAKRLVDAGYKVQAWNRSPAPLKLAEQWGVISQPSALNAVEGADIVLSMLSDDQAARQVWLDPDRGAIQAVMPNMIILESSTVSEDWVKTLGVAVAERRGHLLDAPVAGSRPQAEAGQLIFMVGGKSEILEKAEPFLKTLGGQIHHVGDLGRGAQFKLAVNSLFASQLVTFAEVLALLQRAGFEPARSAEILSNFPIVAPALAGAMKLMATNHHQPLFPIDLMVKDLGYAQDWARQQRSDSSALDLAYQTFSQALSRGWGDQHVTAIAKLH